MYILNFSMTYKVKVSSQNQVTLPVGLLEDMGVGPGGYIQITKREGVFVVETFREVLGRLKNTVSPKPGYEHVDVDDAINKSITEHYSKSSNG